MFLWSLVSKRLAYAALNGGYIYLKPFLKQGKHSAFIFSRNSKSDHGRAYPHFHEASHKGK
jgi:hypothetical protein